MKYELWSVISMTEGEPMVPFIKLKESENFEEIFVEFNKAVDTCVIVANKEQTPILEKYLTDEKIFESPDGGKTIFERTMLKNNRKQIK